MPNASTTRALAKLIITVVIGLVAMVTTGVGLGIIAGLAWLVFSWFSG